MRSNVAASAGAALLLALGAAGCHDQQSFVVVTAQSADATPIAGVTELVVTVTNGASVKVLTYPPPDQVPFTLTGTLDPVTGKIGKTFSVSFGASRTDLVTVAVVARDAARCAVGAGQNSTQIIGGSVGHVTVALAHQSGPCEGGDGGAGDGGELIFPGCDPASATCGAGMTCGVDCAAQMGACIAAGAGPAGSLCTQNADCAPGTQCFTYSGPQSCQVRSCLKFCHTDADCGAPGSGSLCQGQVPCMVGGSTVITGYHTCTFACDPRGTATTGCPAGLHCFVVGDNDAVDCACTEASRTKQEGQPCALGLDCAPGLICNQMAGTSICRKVCRRSDNGSDCGAGQTCTQLTADQTYGACLP